MTTRIPELHKICLQVKDKSLAERLETIAKYFIGTPYGSWPDGTTFESLDDFGYSLNLLDGVTFVEAALALAKTQPLPDYEEFKQEFENILRLIHYAKGQTNFVSRNHFMSVDWILNNKFIVDDITTSLSQQAKIAEALIDKLTWIKRHRISKDQSSLPESVLMKFQPQISRLPYIELQEFMQDYVSFQQKFPDYCIVNIVSPNWDLTEKIGTHLNVSQLGFAFKDHGSSDIGFYLAADNNPVMRLNLYDYLSNCMSIPTIKGINVLVVTPGYHQA